jgi:hypothetical protein
MPYGLCAYLPDHLKLLCVCHILPSLDHLSLRVFTRPAHDYTAGFFQNPACLQGSKIQRGCAKRVHMYQQHTLFGLVACGHMFSQAFPHQLFETMVRWHTWMLVKGTTTQWSHAHMHFRLKPRKPHNNVQALACLRGGLRNGTADLQLSSCGLRNLQHVKV